MTPEQSQTTDTPLELSVPPEPSSVPIARHFAATIAREAGCDEDDVEDLKVAISEAMTNAVKEHQLTSVDSDILLHAWRTTGGVAFEIVDAGRGFAYAADGTSDVTPAAGLYEGSLGLTLIKTLYPDVVIERNVERGMRVRFVAPVAPASRTGSS